MSILLTGSSGFIGSYFRNHFNKKYNITTFSLQKNNIDDIDFSSISVVVHLAALVHQMNGADNDEYNKINIDYTVELVKKAKECGVEHFVFMSTVKVYGEESENIYNENTLCKPIDPYGISKLKAENLIKKLECKNFKVSIIRTPVVYGKGVKANILNLISLVNRIPFIPLGNIQNKRSMVYIGNLCSLIDKVIEKKQSGIFLAADDNPISTSYLIQLIANGLEKRIFLFSVPFFSTFLKRYKLNFYQRLFMNLELDNSNTKEQLSFENPYSIEEGINKMLEDMKV